MEMQINSHPTRNDEPRQYFRFQVFQGAKDSSGRVSKSKSVGMAYLKEGQSILSLRLWTFSGERYFILPHKSEPSQFLVMTRELQQNPRAKAKYFWNIVGNGTVNSIHGYIELNFDLFSKPIFVSLHPEASALSQDLPHPDTMDGVA